MDPACIPLTALPGTSQLFGDYCYNFARVAGFYRHDPHSPEALDAAARQVDYPDERRAAMAKALAGQNPPSDLLTRFAQPGTVAVVTGQQVGLFSGPAYTIYKALTAARLAADLTSRGTPAVPVFWLATEDHDFAEINHTWVFDRDRQPVELRMEAPQGWEKCQRPAGNYPVDRPPIEELRRALAGFAYAEEVVAATEESYCPGATMGSGFRALLRKLLYRVGMLVIDPMQPAVRSIGAPFLAEALRAAPDLKAALLARNAELERVGYHAQVLVEPQTSLFFLLEGGDRLTLRRPDAEFAALADRAEAISPNALLRPVWQDYLLPTAAYVGGPGEVAYFAQSSVLFDHLLGRMPVAVPRAGFTLLDPRGAKLLHRFGLTLPDVMVPEEALQARIARTLVPEALENSFTETAAATGARLDALGAQLKEFDPTLAAAMAKSRAKVLYQIDKLRRKTARETLRRDSQASADAAYLRGLLYPQRHLQERLHSMLPFLAEYGFELVERLYGQLTLRCPDHHVIVL